MALYTPCPDCGANLDPGETCDCRKEEQDNDDRRADRNIGQVYE